MGAHFPSVYISFGLVRYLLVLRVDRGNVRAMPRGPPRQRQLHVSRKVSMFVDNAAIHGESLLQSLSVESFVADRYS